MGALLALTTMCLAPAAQADTPKRLKVGKRLSWKGAVSERCEKYKPLITKQATLHKLDVGLLMAISRIESGFNPSAKNGSGATGLMQVMPSTGRRLKCGDLLNPAKNVACAARLLRKLLDYYDDRLVFAVAGYARGLGHPNSAKKANRTPSTRYLEAVLRERSRYLRGGCRLSPTKRK